MAQTVYSFEVKNASQQSISLKTFEGKVLLIVNVASACGYTPQYEGLETLYKKYKDRGLVVLGFPCNQFGAQEAGSDAEIQTFCKTKFGVDFPVFAKIDVNGANAHPLYSFLKEKCPGILGTEGIKWNFTKFLVGPDGMPLERFAPKDEPASIATKIEKLLT